MLNRMFMKALIGLLLGCFLSTAGATETVIYYHNDALGSPIAATNAEGQVVWREQYQPYGERLVNEPKSRNPLWYTGKPEEEALGLSYFGARWYNPKLGRFMGMDPAEAQAENLHSFNRYAYANNNPYKFVDPDGNSPLDIGFFVLDAINFGLAAASGDPQAIASAGVDLAASAAGLINPVPGTGLALKAARTADKVADVAKGLDNASDVANKANKLILGRGPRERLDRLAIEQGGRISNTSSTDARKIFKQNYRDMRSADEIVQFMDDIPQTLNPGQGGQFARAEKVLIDMRKDLLEKTTRIFERSQ